MHCHSLLQAAQSEDHVLLWWHHILVKTTHSISVRKRVDVLCRASMPHAMRWVGTAKLTAKIPCLKKLLTQAEFEERKRKVVEAVRRMCVSPPSSQCVSVSSHKDARNAHITRMCTTVESSKFFSDFGSYIFPVCRFIFSRLYFKTYEQGYTVL